MTRTFDEVADALGRAGTDISPAELQGFLCGHLCTGQRNHDGWLRYAHGFLDIGELSIDIKNILIDLFEESEAHIKNADFEFSLLLPDEDEALYLRALLMGQWCQGFLTSFGMGCSDDRAQLLSEDAKATLADLVAITQISEDDLESDDAAEADFIEVAEYVRIAILGLAMECRDAPPDTPVTALH